MIATKANFLVLAVCASLFCTTVQAIAICARPKGTEGDLTKHTNFNTESEAQDWALFNQKDIFQPGVGIKYYGADGLLQDDCSVFTLGHRNTPLDSMHATSFGDPHFRTWNNGGSFDFHGECDLVLLDNPGFWNGLGMKIHIRTKIETWWSFIESAAIQIGKETLEVHGGMQHIRYRVNGARELFEVTNDATAMEAFPVHFRRINPHQSQVRVDLGEGNAVSIETFKRFTRVNLNVHDAHNFMRSVGLLGSFPEGTKLARDGITVLEDSNKFGQEWQVRPDEAIFYQDVNSGQSTSMCVMPEQRTKQEKRRRLGEATIQREAAAAACAHAKKEDYDSCIFDVMTTNDIEMAGSYA